MKTKNILLPTIALLAGAVLITPSFAQELDYHELESIKQEITSSIKISVPQKTYLHAQCLFNQMNEDLPIDYDKLLEAASNSVNDDKISAQEQYELMVFAIQTNHNKVLETLLKAGFKAYIDVELNQAGTKVTPLAEIAQKFQNEEAVGLIDAYTPKARLKKMHLNKSFLKTIQQKPHGEYMYRIDKKKPAATATIKVVPNEPFTESELQRKIDSLEKNK